jgi:hypothetical protein
VVFQAAHLHEKTVGDLGGLPRRYACNTRFVGFNTRT